MWEDPFVKPCYLFALVAGDLAVSEDSFRTASGRDVTLRIYTQAKNIDRVGWAMESLKRAMKWDEDTFGARSLQLLANLGYFQATILWVSQDKAGILSLARDHLEALHCTAEQSYEACLQLSGKCHRYTARAC